MNDRVVIIKVKSRKIWGIVIFCWAIVDDYETMLDIFLIYIVEWISIILLSQSKKYYN